MLAALVFALIGTKVSAGSEPPCSQVKAVQNFDMDALSTGIWYEIARYPTSWEDKGECTIVRFYRDGNEYKFYISEVLETSGKWNNGSGVMSLASNGKSGIIKFVSPWFEATTGSKEATTTIIDVDFDHYCIFFECRYNATAKIQTNHVWITSRAPTLEPEGKKKLEEFIARNKYLDKDKLIWDMFGKYCRPAN